MHNEILTSPLQYLFNTHPSSKFNFIYIMADGKPAIPFFKKGKSRPANNRRRDASDASGMDTGSSSVKAKSEVVLPSRKQGSNLLSAGTKRPRSNVEELDGDDEREGPDVKWTAAGSHQHAAQEIIAGDEAEAILAKRTRKVEADDDDRPNDGLYRGANAYKSHIKKSQEVPKAMRTGPQRNTSSTIRTVTIVDYQPDVCKDYKGMSQIYEYMI